MTKLNCEQVKITGPKLITCASETKQKFIKQASALKNSEQFWFFCVSFTYNTLTLLIQIPFPKRLGLYLKRIKN